MKNVVVDCGFRRLIQASEMNQTTKAAIHHHIFHPP